MRARHFDGGPDPRLVRSPRGTLLNVAISGVTLRVGAGFSTDVDALRATADAARDARADLGEHAPDLVLAFIAKEHRAHADAVAAFLGERFPGAAILGVASAGVVAGAHELESGPAVSLWCARLPDTAVVPFTLDFVEGEEGEGTYRGWPPDVPADATVLMFADPFSFPAGHLAATVNRDRPGLRVIGGIAAGVQAEGDARLILGGAVAAAGAVAVAIHGRARVDTLVSQGCRPIGEPATVTRADRNIIFELAGHPPIEQIRRIWSEALPQERALMQEGLFIGRVVDEYKTEFGRGDFIIRSVVGADPETGFVAVGDVVNVGETVQFHVRDPKTADEDLYAMLGRTESTPAGALLFTCNGRGTNLFDHADHDAVAVSKTLGGGPVAGFFANGELGPVGGKNFLHGHTASIALFVDTAP